ncbi:MAG: hypothetical protein JRN06_12550 [Nitrososphaerota archaeon]|nr:hypothetical protein [Nitrososphaerota archaeon]
MVIKGQSIASIADKLKTTRQFVNQTKLTAEAKVGNALIDAARANNIQVTKTYPYEGVLLGYHPGLERRAIVTYSTEHGIKVWYWFDKPEEITDKEFLSLTRTYLLGIAHERDLIIENAEKLHPARLAQVIFSELIPELKA